MFCKYKDVLGVPKQGFHAPRLLGFAAYDVIGTFMLGLLFSILLNKSYWSTTLVLFLLGIFLHWLFCVDTTFNRLLGLV